MSYKILTKKSVSAYLKRIKEMKKFFSSFNSLEIEEVGDGNLNFVYKITNRNKPTETVVLKQAVPYLRCVGESWPLNKERMNFEIMALEKYNELYPACVPDVYYSDKEMALVIMRNLNHHKILRGEMNQGKIFPKLADHISSFLAHTLFYTSGWSMSSFDKKEAVKKFINKDLCDLTERFIFTDPFYDSATNKYNPDLSRKDINSIHSDKNLRVEVSQLRQRFMDHADCLLHGDLHTGSIMVNENETYVIDPEFAFYGPAGFDPGLFIGNLLLAYVAHSYRQKELLNNETDEYQTWILETIKTTWNEFVRKYDALWKDHVKKSNDKFWNYEGGIDDHASLRQKEMKRIFHDTVGFAGCSMIRRTLGIAKVSDIADIKDTKARAKLDRFALNIGRGLIMNRKKLKSIDDVIKIAATACGYKDRSVCEG